MQHPLERTQTNAQPEQTKTAPQSQDMSVYIQQLFAMHKDMLARIEKIQRYILWMRIMNIIKFVVIVVPILFGLWYLSPYLKEAQKAFGLYGELLGVSTSTEQQQTQQLDPDTVEQIEQLMQSQQLQQLLKSYKVSP